MSSLSNAQRRPIDSKEEVPKRVGPGDNDPVEVLAGESSRRPTRDCKRGDVPTLTAISTRRNGAGTVLARPFDTYARDGPMDPGDYDNKREPTKAEVGNYQRCRCRNVLSGRTVVSRKLPDLEGERSTKSRLQAPQGLAGLA